MSGFAGAWMMTKLWKPAAANRQQIGPVLVLRNELASKKMEKAEEERSKGDQIASGTPRSKGAVLEGAKGKKESRSSSSGVLSEAALCMLMDRFAPS